MKKRLVPVLKIVVPALIIGYLVYSVFGHQPGSEDEAGTFEQVGRADWKWGSLVGALVLAMSAVSLSFCRWYLLVRALELEFRLRDAFRLGFVGYLLNFVGAGSVGGDLFKAVFIAHEQQGRRTEAVATVVVDRMIGLYALLVVTSLAIYFVDHPTSDVVTLRRLTYLFTLLGGIAVIMVLVPGFTSGTVSELLGSLPKIGPTLERLIAAIRMFRQRKGILLATCVMSLGVHTLLAGCLWCIAQGLFDRAPGLAAPTLLEHLIIAPMTMLCAALPISPAGLGTFELALEGLYRMLPAKSMQPGQGLIVALGFRVVQIGLLIIGAIFYWTNRREVSELIHEAELEASEP